MPSKNLSETEAFALDVAKRTLYTGVEAAAAAAVPLFTTNVASNYHAALLTAAAGVGGAFLAAVRTSLATAFGKGGADRVQAQTLVDDDLDAIHSEIVDVVRQHVPEAVRTALRSAPLGPGLEPEPEFEPEPQPQPQAKPVPLVTGTAVSKPHPKPKSNKDIDGGTLDTTPSPSPLPASTEPEPDADDDVPAELPAAAPLTMTVYDRYGTALGEVESANIVNGDAS